MGVEFFGKRIMLESGGGGVVGGGVVGGGVVGGGVVGGGVVGGGVGDGAGAVVEDTLCEGGTEV